VGDDDYQANTGGTIAFLGTAGETHEFVVEVNGDQIVELDEIFNVVLGALTNIDPTAGDDITTVNGQGTIVNDDHATLSINDVSQTETDGLATFTFTVSSTAQVDTAVMLTSNTADGSAVEGGAGVGDDDYEAFSNGSIAFAPGSTSETIDVTINGDQVVELDEDVFVNLTNLLAGGRDVTFADDQGEGTIQNDDSATISISDVSQTETDGDATFTFTLSSTAQVDTAVRLTADTADGSAIEAGTSVGDDDYEAISGASVDFASGSISETIDVTINGDQVVELDENFFVNLSNLLADGRDVTFADD
jgi:hypothetical protein